MIDDEVEVDVRRGVCIQQQGTTLHVSVSSHETHPSDDAGPDESTTCDYAASRPEVTSSFSPNLSSQRSSISRCEKT